MPKPHWTAGRLALYAVLLASLGLSAAGVLLVSFDDDLRPEEIMSALGLNLIASVIFAVIFSLVSSNIQERLLLERIEGTIAGVSQELLGKLAGYEAHYMPSATYEAGEQWNSPYNDDVTRSLTETTSYAFRGTSAKYVPSRLQRAHRGRLRQVDIIMLDPRARRTLEARAAIKRDQTRDSRSVRQVADDIADEILMSVVALFDCRHILPMRIAFVRNVAATRIELFDDAVFISWYQGPDSARKPFPESLRFDKGTFPYEVRTQEFHGSHGQADYPLEITKDFGESDLIQHLSTLAGREVTQDDVSNWRKRHARYVAKFAKFLDSR